MSAFPPLTGSATDAERKINETDKKDFFFDRIEQSRLCHVTKKNTSYTLYLRGKKATTKKQKKSGGKGGKNANQPEGKNQK